ncbi:uncharacterized protein LOC129284315 isoform X2 [Prosopis cineraria]|uniref:uncharacterized protein LOC129284315 isoform X2 n=1 Tax=Prosopis cineraria TaxID=364024 RepID=UPI00240FF0D6|nr:uncharacterized protein LOC129284315 isoform X2 [Prosopis cineraria]
MPLHADPPKALGVEPTSTTMEGGTEELQWQSEPEAESIVSVTLARAMSALLCARPKKLQDAIFRLSSLTQRPSMGSLEDSLWFLHKYVSDAAEKEDSFDQVLVPMIENALKSKDSKHGGQAMILINWLFQDELLFEPLTNGLASIVTRKNDRYLLVGWCVIVRALVDYDTITSQSPFSGIRGRCDGLIKILSACLPHLAGIVCQGSTLQDGFELPTRLGVSAADCFLTLTETLTKMAESQSNKLKSDARATSQLITLVPSASDKEGKLASKSLTMPNTGGDYILWHHLDGMICLVQRLLAWNKKSRFLHAKGLEQVLKWLEEIKNHYCSLQDEADSNVLKTGDLLLSSCWKHYSRLLYLEDQKFPQRYKELLDQYLSGIQYYMDNHSCGLADKKDSEVETRRFFLICLCLLLGRLDSKKFESTILECGMDISRILVPQLTCTSEDIIDGVVSIFKAIISKPNCSTGSTNINSRQVDAVMPFLLHLLDEQEGTARAVVKLIAEYCSMSEDGKCLEEVLKRLSSGNISQRRNAIGVISEVIDISTNSQKSSLLSAWQDVANSLLERLGDEDIVIQELASKLLPALDPSLHLPTLVSLVYSPIERVQSSATDALIRVLKFHNQKNDVLLLMLDCLSNISQSVDLPEVAEKKGSKLDADRVLKLTPEWSNSVQDWSFLIGPLIDKMFADPSNAIIVRFLSYISENLSDATDLVLHQVLLHARGQKEIDESFLSRWENRTYTNDEFVEMQHSLFEHLCPLLIIKMLPLKAFNDRNSLVMYGNPSQDIMPGTRIVEVGHECIAGLLLSRAFCDFEFEDVRKLAAELCGRIHPQVLFPVLCSKLKQAVDTKNILKIKACLLSTCTSLVIRGWESFSHPAIFTVRKMIEIVLLWPSLDADSVSKAQHGCIDCLALLLCAELQAEESITKYDSGSASGVSVITYVISHLIHDKEDLNSASEMDGSSSAFASAVPLPFRLCMANVLISACQKISKSCANQFAAHVLPSLLSVESKMKSEIRASCIQVLFSAVYHLRSAVLPYASELFKVSLRVLKNESEKERMAGAKLMASLMASEDVILESISAGLLEARSVLSTMSLSEPSPEIRQLCRKLLACISST